MHVQTKPSLKCHKMDLREVPIGAIRIVEMLEKHSFTALIAGGAVRDLIVDRRPKDYDFVTDASLADLQELFGEVKPSGLRFGIAVVRIGSDYFEVSCFRQQDGRISIRDSTAPQTSCTFERRLIEDVASRDFTINSLYYNPMTRLVYDLHDGLSDIERKCVRYLQDPADGIRNNPLTMLRAIRFSQAMQFRIDSQASAAMSALAVSLTSISADRLTIELGKHLASGHAQASVRSMIEYGLLEEIFGKEIIGERPSCSLDFIDTALSKIDDASSVGVVFSHAFLFSVVLWPQVREQLRPGSNKPHAASKALLTSGKMVLQKCRTILKLDTGLGDQILAIWLTQLVFEAHPSQMPKDFTSHPFFKAGLNFLFIRCATEELSVEMGERWQVIVSNQRHSTPADEH